MDRVKKSGTSGWNLRRRESGSMRSEDVEAEVVISSPAVSPPSSPRERPPLVEPETVTSIVASGETPASPRPVVKTNKRTQIATEILNTEKSYVESLQVMKIVYEAPLRETVAAGKEIVSEKDVGVLFAHLDPIIAYNNVLLDKLQKTIGEDNFDPESTLLGPIFMELGFFLKTYSAYVNNFAGASDLLNTLMKKKPKFKEFMGQCKQDPRAQSKSLVDFLIMPVQRIPRYSLLLADLIRNTDAAHPDSKPLNDALARINEVATSINEAKASQDDFVLISKIQAQLTDTVYNLSMGKRKLMREEKGCFITYVEEDGTYQPQVEHTRVFFFSDCLFFAQKARGGKLSVRKWYWLQELLPIEAQLTPVAEVSPTCIKIVLDPKITREASTLAANNLISFIIATMTAKGMVKRLVKVLKDVEVTALKDEFALAAGFDSRKCKLLYKGEAMPDGDKLASFNLNPTDMLHLIPDDLSMEAFASSSSASVSTPQALSMKLSIEPIQDTLKVNPHFVQQLCLAVQSNEEGNVLFYIEELDKDEMEYLSKQLSERVVHCRANPVNLVRVQRLESVQQEQSSEGDASGGDDGATDDEGKGDSHSLVSSKGFLSSVFSLNRRHSGLTVRDPRSLGSGDEGSSPSLGRRGSAIIGRASRPRAESLSSKEMQPSSEVSAPEASTTTPISSPSPVRVAATKPHSKQCVSCHMYMDISFGVCPHCARPQPIVTETPKLERSNSSSSMPATISSQQQLQAEALSEVDSKSALRGYQGRDVPKPPGNRSSLSSPLQSRKPPPPPAPPIKKGQPPPAPIAEPAPVNSLNSSHAPQQHNDHVSAMVNTLRGLGLGDDEDDGQYEDEEAVWGNEEGSGVTVASSPPVPGPNQPFPPKAVKGMKKGMKKGAFKESPMLKRASTSGPMGAAKSPALKRVDTGDVVKSPGLKRASGVGTPAVKRPLPGGPGSAPGSPSLSRPLPGGPAGSPALAKRAPPPPSPGSASVANSTFPLAAPGSPSEVASSASPLLAKRTPPPAPGSSSSEAPSYVEAPASRSGPVIPAKPTMALAKKGVRPRVSTLGPADQSQNDL